MNKQIINLMTDGKVKTKDREFTRVIGGFGDDKPIITDKQMAEILNYSKGARQVRETFNKNKEHFKEKLDYIDISKGVAENDTLREVLISLGYAKASITQANNIYIFSEAGFLLFLKFSEGEKSVEIYKDFLEDYFETKAENTVMTKTLEENKQAILEERKYILGSVIMESDSIKKMELLERDKKLEEQIKEIELTLSKEKLMEQVQDSIEIAERFTNSGGLYDVGNFSKILNIKSFGRNKLFEWMRDNKILNMNNIPFQNQMSHFKVIPIENNKFATSKTLIKSQGISYIVKKLIKDGIIKKQSYDCIIKNISENLKEVN